MRVLQSFRVRAAECVKGARLDRDATGARLKVLPLEQIGELLSIKLQGEAEPSFPQIPINERCANMSSRVLNGVVNVDLLNTLSTRPLLKTVADALGPRVTKRPSYAPRRNYEFRTFIEQRKAKVNVIKEHMRGDEETVITDVITNDKRRRPHLSFIAAR